MPGGNGNISGKDGNTFSSTNQPKNRRKSTKFLTDLLTKELKGKTEIMISGFDPETGKPTKIKVPMPTKQNIVQALLRQAAKGNVHAIKEVWDRIEGKTIQPVQLSGDKENPIPIETITKFDIDYTKLPTEVLEAIVNARVQQDTNS